MYACEASPTLLRSTGSNALLASNLMTNAIVAAKLLIMPHSLGFHRHFRSV